MLGCIFHGNCVNVLLLFLLLKHQTLGRNVLTLCHMMSRGWQPAGASFIPHHKAPFRPYRGHTRGVHLGAPSLSLPVSMASCHFSAHIWALPL